VVRYFSLEKVFFALLHKCDSLLPNFTPAGDWFDRKMADNSQYLLPLKQLDPTTENSLMVFQTLLCFEYSRKYCIWSCSHLLAIFLNATNLLNADGGFKLQTSTRRGTKVITGNKKHFKISGM
jgi:hypothetical protein